jgi:hypothetical protein
LDLFELRKVVSKKFNYIVDTPENVVLPIIASFPISAEIAEDKVENTSRSPFPVSPSRRSS